MQYVPCNSALLAQETPVLTKKKQTLFGEGPSRFRATSAILGPVVIFVETPLVAVVE